MSEAAGDTVQSLAARLGACRVGIRSDLHVSRHLLRGTPCYVVKDPLTFRAHSLELADYRIFCRLGPDRTLAEVLDELIRDGVVDEDATEAFYRFVYTLHRLNLLQLPISDEQRLFRRYEQVRSEERRQAWARLVRAKIPLFNPNPMLDRTVRVVRPLFSRRAFAVWLIVVATALVIAMRNADALVEPLSRLLLGSNLPLLWLSLIGLKVLHEFGHAYACKLLGADVPEMGVNLICLTPLPYVDATAAWTFTRKRDRIIVSLAGVYVELFIAALAMMVWVGTEPSLLNATAFNIAFLASVVTVGFNINPLMRFDGYYVLSDLVECPNLSSRSTEHAGNVLKRVAFGTPMPPTNLSRRFQAFLFLFGVSVACYRVVLVLAISATVATKYFLLGTLMAAGFLVLQCAQAVRVATRTIRELGTSGPSRLRAAVVCGSLAVVVPACIWFLPIPSRVVAPAVMTTADQTVVRAEAPGFVKAMLGQTAARVARGDVLVELEPASDDRALVEAEGRLQEARLRARALGVEDVAGSLREHRRVEHFLREVGWRRTESARHLVVAPFGGVVVASLVAQDAGRYVKAGQPVAVLASGPPELRTVLNGEQMAGAHPAVGQNVTFRCAADPLRSIRGTIRNIRPLGRVEIGDVNMTHLVGGDIIVDPQTGEALEPHFEILVALEPDDVVALPNGSTGRVLLDARHDSLGRRALRDLLRILQALQT